MGYPAASTYPRPDSISGYPTTDPEPTPLADASTPEPRLAGPLLDFLETTGLHRDHYLAQAITHLVNAANPGSNYTNEIDRARQWCYRAMTLPERGHTA